MKLLLYIRRVLFGGAFMALGAFSPAAHAGNSRVSARKAIDLAQEQLDLRGLQSTVQIESVVLQSVTILGASRVWTVLWSQPISSDSGKFEVGVEVDMNGKLVRLVKKTAPGAKAAQ
jgi:hypothetical protein